MPSTLAVDSTRKYGSARAHFDVFVALVITPDLIASPHCVETMREGCALLAPHAVLALFLPLKLMWHAGGVQTGPWSALER